MFRNPLPDTSAVATHHEEVRDEVVASGFEEIALNADLSKHHTLRPDTHQFELHLEKSGFIHVRPSGSGSDDMASVAVFDISQLAGMKGRTRHEASLHTRDYGTQEQAVEHVDPLHRWSRFAECAINSRFVPPMADSWIDNDLPVEVPRELQFGPYQE